MSSSLPVSNQGLDTTVLVKYMTDYDEYSPFTVVLDHLQFSTLSDYASSARARLESSRLHAPPLLFLFRVTMTAPLFEKASLGDPMGSRKWLLLKEFDVNDEERDLPKLQATLFGTYAREARDVTEGDILVLERPLIQARTRRWDDDDEDEEEEDRVGEFELVLGAGKMSQRLCSRLYIFRTRVAETETNAVTEQETTPKKRPRKDKRPRKRTRTDGDDTAAAEEATVGQVVADDIASQSASSDRESSSTNSDSPPRRALFDARVGGGEAAVGNNITGSAQGEVGGGSTAAGSGSALREGRGGEKGKSTAERMNRNLDDAFAQESRRPREEETRRVEYTVLNGCKINTRFLFNVWAVITKVRRRPSPTARNSDRVMAQVYIQDQTFAGSFGFTDYQFSMVGLRREDFPPLAVGAVVRIHDMETQPYLGESTGRVWSPAKVTVIEGGVGDPIEPQNTAQWDVDFRFTDEDAAKVEELRQWWASLSSARSEPRPPAAMASQPSAPAAVMVPEGQSTPPAPSSSPTVTVPEGSDSERSEADHNEELQQENSGRVRRSRRARNQKKRVS